MHRQMESWTAGPNSRSNSGPSTSSSSGPAAVDSSGSKLEDSQEPSQEVDVLSRFIIELAKIA